MKEKLTNIINFLGLAWWLEITTTTPRCIYYFGPFMTAQEAASEKDGYIEDLENEGAQGISVEIKRCKPTKLTIADDLDDLDEDLEQDMAKVYKPSIVLPAFASL